MPRPELRGRLRYQGCGPGSRLSLLHLRLSAAAARALRGCGRRQDAPGPVIAFQGNQGYLTVPGGPGTPPRLFAFSLSRCSRDAPGGRLECVRLAVPRLGPGRLVSLGSVRQKITLRARESGCPARRQRVEEPGGTARVEPAPAVPGHGEGVRGPGAAGALGRGSACPGPRSGSHRPARVSPRAAAPSLAPRARRGRERPEGLPAGRPGEVTELDPAACCHRLRGTPTGRGPGEWPEPAAQAALPQRRSQDRSPPAPAFLVPLEQPLEQPLGHGCPHATGRNLLGVKRLALLAFSDPAASKSSRAPASDPGSGEWRRSGPQALRGAGGQQQAAPLPASSRAGELGSGEGEEEGAPRPEQHPSAPRDAGTRASGSVSAEIPDFLRRYRPISSPEQRSAYEAAFSADYPEYRHLHARVAGASRKFAVLGARLRALARGTEERKALEAAILHEYSRFRETYPSYRQEKRRCEYLHQKLAHIKSLVLRFDGSGSA